jgi:hypothetical protein
MIPARERRAHVQLVRVDRVHVGRVRPFTWHCARRDRQLEPARPFGLPAIPGGAGGGSCIANRGSRYPTAVIPVLEMVNPRREGTVQVTPLVSDRQLKGPSTAVRP